MIDYPQVEQEASYFYLVDVLSGWTLQAKLVEKGFDAAIESMKGLNNQEILHQSQALMRGVSKTKARTARDDMLKALCSAVAVVRSSPAHDLIMAERNALFGNWFYVGYHLYDGTYMAQMAYLPPQANATNPDDFRHNFYRIVDGHLDLMRNKRGESHLGKTMWAGGGPILPILPMLIR